MVFNAADIVVVIIVAIIFVASLIAIRRNNGKCALCSHGDSCPFKKVKKNV